MRKLPHTPFLVLATTNILPAEVSEPFSIILIAIKKILSYMSLQVA